MAARRGEALRSGIGERLKRANVRFRPGYLRFSPEWIILGVNNVCNLHCKMCAVGTGYDKSNFFQHWVGARPINMPRALIFDIIDQTAATFPAAKLGYTFTEPTIYPHLIESFQHAQDKGLFTSITGLNQMLCGLVRIWFSLRLSKEGITTVADKVTAIKASDRTRLLLREDELGTWCQQAAKVAAEVAAEEAAKRADDETGPSPH